MALECEAVRTTWKAANGNGFPCGLEVYNVPTRRRDVGPSLESRLLARRRLADHLLDDVEREEERRAALSDEERAAEDQAHRAEEERKRREWLAHHERCVNLRVDVVADGGLKMTHASWDRQRLREQGYVLDRPEGSRTWFEAVDRKWYPFEMYRDYDKTGELPQAETASNPIAEWFWNGVLDRAKERRIGPFRPLAPPIQEEALPASWEERVEKELQRLLANHEASERRRAGLSPEELAAEDRERHERVARIEAQAEQEQRTTIKVRRDGEDEIHKLSRHELRAKGFQPLFALQRAGRDVYFEAHDGAWYRIEAYPEYARSAVIPAAHFAAPHWERKKTPLEEAVYRFQKLVQAKQE